MFGWGNSEYSQLFCEDIQQVNKARYLKKLQGLGKIVDIAAGGSLCSVVNGEKINCNILFPRLAALAQMVACLPLVQQIRGSIPGGVVNFQPWVDCTSHACIKFQTLLQYIC